MQSPAAAPVFCTDMTYCGIALSELIAQGINPSFIRLSLQFAFERLMEVDIETHCQAARGRRSDARINSRNGYRHCIHESLAGQLKLKIPKLRYGGYYPAFLERRRRVERALISVIHEAYFSAPPTRSIQELRGALAAVGTSPANAPILCLEIHKRVKEYLLWQKKGVR